MEWAHEAWFNLDQSVIVNCWRHTTLFSDTNPNAIPINIVVTETNEELTNMYEQFIQAADIQSAMSLNDFINPLEEEQNHELLTDEEILEAAATVDHDKEQEEAEAAAPMLYSDLSKQEQVIALAKSITICETRGLGDGLVLTALKRIQCDIH